MAAAKTDCNYLAHALSIVVVGASGDLAKKKVSELVKSIFESNRPLPMCTC